MIDLVTVVHNDQNWKLSRLLELQIHNAHDGLGPPWSFTRVDNRVDNRGFAKASNLGAQSGDGDIIGFINPDVVVLGPFLDEVADILAGPDVMVTGSNFGKPPWEYQLWGCHNWVCGAAMFVRRDWWVTLSGFDERYVWGWEETDFIRRTEFCGLVVQSAELSLSHTSPTADTDQDVSYKVHHFNNGARLFYARWGGRFRPVVEQAD